MKTNDTDRFVYPRLAEDGTDLDDGGGSDFTLPLPRKQRVIPRRTYDDRLRDGFALLESAGGEEG